MVTQFEVLTIVTILSVMVSVGISYLKNRMAAGETFNVGKTIFVLLAAGVIQVTNFLTNGELLSDMQVWQQVATLVGIELSFNSVARTIVSQNVALSGAVDDLEEQTAQWSIPGVSQREKDEHDNEPKLYDIGFTLLPVEQTVASGGSAAFTLACSDTPTGPNRIAEATIDYGDGHEERTVPKNGLATFSHVYVFPTGAPYLQKVYNVNITLVTAAGYSESLQEHGRKPCRVNVIRPEAPK